MREIEGTVEQFANKTWPANPNATLVLTLTAVVSSVIGIPSNLALLFLSFLSSKIEGEYKYFIANLALCDLSYCLAAIFQCVVHLYHRFGNVPMDMIACTWQTSVPYTTGLCLGFALPLSSVNRFVVIVLTKEWFSGKRAALLLCLTSYIPILHHIITFMFSSYVVYYPYCNYTLYVPYSIEPFFAYVIVIAYPTLMFCNYRIYRVLMQHRSTAMAILKKSASQVENERSILKAIVVQGAAPVFCAFPIGMVLLSVFFWGWNRANWVLFNMSEDMVLSTMDVCWIFFVLTPSIDAVVVLLVVKQYRKACADILRRFPCRLCQVLSTTESSTIFRTTSRGTNKVQSTPAKPRVTPSRSNK